MKTFSKSLWAATISLVLSCAHQETLSDLRFLNYSESEVPTGSSKQSDEAAQKPAGPDWIHEDCVQEGDYYFFVGYGEGGDASGAIRNALIGSRKNALTCTFGGTLTGSIQLEESGSHVSYRSSTHIQLNYDHVNWAGYEQVPGRVHFPRAGEHKVYSQYRWHKKEIEKERERLKSMAKQIEKNKALQKEIELAKEVSAEREVLVRAQKAELARLKAHEAEIQNMKNESEKVLAKLERMKKKRQDKGNEFVKMATQFGCDVTYDDLVELLGPPDNIKVMGICFDSCRAKWIGKFIPVLQYIYGDYAFLAYLQGVEFFGQEGWSSALQFKKDVQMVSLAKIKGTPQEWWICRKGYDFVTRLLKS